MDADHLGARPPAPRRVLSIQSHVVYGYVGGKAATFPLQLLGWDVDVVNTVHFSNHSGYRRFGGTKATASDLAALFDELDRNGLLQPSRVLTGYIPNAAALEEVSKLVRLLRERDATLVYLLDPVMGDAGQLYVSPDVVPLYRALLPCATIITPNHFEVEVLTQVPLTAHDELRRALDILHVRYRVPHVVVSSIPLTDRLRIALEGVVPPPAEKRGDSDGSDELLCVCSSSRGSGGDGPISAVHALRIWRRPGYFSGVGDLFSALVLAHFDAASEADALSVATGKAVFTLQAILRETEGWCQEVGPEECPATDDELDVAAPERVVRRMRARELRLVQNAGAIVGAGQSTGMMCAAWTEFWRL